MLNIELDPARQKQLDALAQSVGQQGSSLALQILQDFLDFHALPDDTEDAWAESSAAMAAEIMEDESWETPSDEP